MKLKVAIVDDQIEIAKATAEELRKLDFLEVHYVTADVVDFLNYVQILKPEVVIMDIEMPKVNGIDAARWIRTHTPGTHIVFATSYTHFMADAFRVYADDYILKPIDYKRLEETLLRVLSKFQDPGQFIEIKTTKETVYIKTKDIIFVEANQKHTLIYTNSEIIEAASLLKGIEPLLPPHAFFKTSRFHIVNSQYIQSILNDSRTSYKIQFKGTDAYALLSKKNYAAFKIFMDQALK